MDPRELEQMIPGLQVIETVPNIMERSSDAEFILEGDEPDVPWFFCRILFSAITPETRVPWDAAGLPAALNPIPGDEEERMRSIKAWMAEFSDPTAALEAEPPLLGYDGNVLDILDGWHRLSLADAASLHEVTVYLGLVGHPDYTSRPSHLA